MRLSIGILAHDESESIEGAIASLLDQTIFEHEKQHELSVSALEVICVPNGCTDDTAARARRAFGRVRDVRASLHVEERATGGKSRNWNVYVHEVSDPLADYVFLADADIVLADRGVLERMLAALIADPVAWVSVDTPVKSVRGSGRRLSVMDRASLAASQMELDRSEAVGISGQLYCARGPILRRTWMPNDLPVEDGFLRAMTVTNGFTEPDVAERVTRVADAVHFYETHTDVLGFLRHEHRLIVGTMLNLWLFEHLWERGRQGHVGAYIEARNRLDPQWLHAYLAEHRKHDRRLWVVHPHYVTKRLDVLKGMRVRHAIKAAPVAVAGTVLQATAAALANLTLQRGRGVGIW